MAVSTVAVVVRQLIRGNAIAHVVFVPWCDRKPRKGRPRECVLTDVTKARPATGRKSDQVGHQDRELPRLHPVDAARRQPRADPEVPEEHLQNTDDDLVALQCTARQERQRRGTITIGNPVHGAFQPNGYVNRSRDMVSPAVYPRLSSHHFDIQSTARKSHCHGYSCRLPALVLNHFDTQSTEITLSWVLSPFTRACSCLEFSPL